MPATPSLDAAAAEVIAARALPVIWAGERPKRLRGDGIGADGWLGTDRRVDVGTAGPEVFPPASSVRSLGRVEGMVVVGVGMPGWSFVGIECLTRLGSEPGWTLGQRTTLT